MKLHLKISSVMKDNNISIYKLSKLSGLSQTGIKYFLSGEKSPTIDTLEKICNALKIDIESLFNQSNEISMNDKHILKLYDRANTQAKETAVFALEKGQPKNIEKGKKTLEIAEELISVSVGQHGITIPVVGRAAAGLPIEMIHESYTSLEVSDERIMPGDFAVIADGDSMVNVGIMPGDRVIIHQQPKVENGEIALVAIECGSTIKRFFKTDVGYKLVSENDKYEPQEFQKNSDVRVLGKVIKVAHSYKEHHNEIDS